MTDNSDDHLFDLDKLFNELSGNKLSAIVADKSRFDSANLFLLLLWGYFHITVVNSKDEEGEGEGSITSLTKPRIITLEEGYSIYDFGDYLKTSAGKDYGSYTTSRLLKTAKAMVALLKQRGAKEVEFSGSSVAERLAWLECKRYNIKTSYSSTKAIALEVRVRNLDRMLNVINISSRIDNSLNV